MDKDVPFLHLTVPSEEEETHTLHVESVVRAMERYQETNYLGTLAIVIYESDKVFDHSIRSLGVSFVTAYLAPSVETRDVTTALAHCSYPDLTSVQTAAVLMVNLLSPYVAQTAGELAVTAETVKEALAVGIAELLNSDQLMLLDLMATSLHVTALTARQLREAAG